jgi:hypothetical protein
MNVFKSNKAIFFILILVLSSVIVITGCTNNEVFVPDYTSVAPPPDEVAIEQLLSDYAIDQVTADKKYKGKTFIFTGIVVEEVGNNVTNHRADPSSDIFIISGLARFTPRYITAFDHIGEDFVVDIIGECKGWQFSRVLITDCWVGVVKGDSANIPSSEY